MWRHAELKSRTPVLSLIVLGIIVSGGCGESRTPVARKGILDLRSWDSRPLIIHYRTRQLEGYLSQRAEHSRQGIRHLSPYRSSSRSSHREIQAGPDYPKHQNILRTLRERRTNRRERCPGNRHRIHRARTFPPGYRSSPQRQSNGHHGSRGQLPSS